MHIGNNIEHVRTLEEKGNIIAVDSIVFVSIDSSIILMREEILFFEFKLLMSILFFFSELQRLPPVVGGGQMGKSSGLSPGLDGCKLGSTTTESSSSGTASSGDHHQLTGGNRPLLQLPLGSCSTTSTTSSSSSSGTGTGKRQPVVASTADPNKRTCLTPAGTHTYLLRGRWPTLLFVMIGIRR